MRLSGLIVGAAVALALSVPAPASAQAAAPPLPGNTFIQFGGLDWAWASPCGFDLGGCVSEYVLVDGFRFATAGEWANRPPIEEFLDPGGNFEGSGGTMRCASEYFNVTPEHTHCDWADAVNGFISSGPDNLGPAVDPNAETWLVRGQQQVVPEPTTWFLMATGLSLVGMAAWRRKEEED